MRFQARRTITLQGIPDTSPGKGERLVAGMKEGSVTELVGDRRCSKGTVGRERKVGGHARRLLEMGGGLDGSGVIHVVVGPEPLDGTSYVSNDFFVGWRKVEVTLCCAFNTVGIDLNHSADSANFLLHAVTIIHVFSPIGRVGPHGQSRGNAAQEGYGKAPVIETGAVEVEESLSLVGQRTTCPTHVIVVWVRSTTVLAH